MNEIRDVAASMNLLLGVSSVNQMQYIFLKFFKTTKQKYQNP
jgi:hypothetical protein